MCRHSNSSCIYQDDLVSVILNIYLRPLHTQDSKPVTIALQALSLVGKAEVVQDCFKLRLRDQWSMWLQDGCKVYMDSYMASNRSCFMVTWTNFENHLLYKMVRLQAQKLLLHICHVQKKWSLSTMQDTNVDIKLMSSPFFSTDNSQETQWRMTSAKSITATTIVKAHIAMFQPLISEVYHMKVIAMMHKNKGWATCDMCKSHVISNQG